MSDKKGIGTKDQDEKEETLEKKSDQQTGEESKDSGLNVQLIGMKSSPASPVPWKLELGARCCRTHWSWELIWAVIEYSAEFCEYVAKVQGWPEEVKIQFYYASLNTDLVAKAMVQDDLKTLLEWIQLTCEAEKQELVVKLIQQQYHAGQKRKQYFLVSNPIEENAFCYILYFS